MPRKGREENVGKKEPTRARFGQRGVRARRRESKADGQKHSYTHTHTHTPMKGSKALQDRRFQSKGVAVRKEEGGLGKKGERNVWYFY